MKRRIMAAFAAGVITCLLLGALVLGPVAVLTDGAEAQDAGTWHVAGGTQGFSIADWGAGRGPEVSLDEWIESVPASCDIQTIARGASFVSAYYRCPSS